MASYSFFTNHQTFSMQVVIVWVFVAAAGAAMLESVFQRSGPVSGAGGRNSRIQCAASCAREKTCYGFVSRDVGACEFKTDSSPSNTTDYYQQIGMPEVSSFPHQFSLNPIFSLHNFP